MIKNAIPAGMEDDDQDDIDFLIDPIQKTCDNLKVTVIPHITKNAGLNNEDFDASLNIEEQEWFKSIQQKWAIYKNARATVDLLKKLYFDSDNPLLLALKLFANCPGCQNAKNRSFPLLFFETIAEVRTEKSEIIDNCTQNMKMIAFNFVKTQNFLHLSKCVTYAYDLDKDNHLFEDKIKDMVLQKNYKDAANWAILLNLTDRFGIFDIVFPLILQDSIRMAEDYLDKEVVLQKPTIELLDSLLDRSTTVIFKCDEYIEKYKYTDVRYEKLCKKTLSKLIVRLAKKYKLTENSIPNVTNSKNFGSLQYLIYKKYIDKSLNHDSWRELVIELVNSNQKELQLELITNTALNDDIKETIFWIKYYKLQMNELPPLVHEHLKNNSSNEQHSQMHQNHQQQQQDFWDEVDSNKTDNKQNDQFSNKTNCSNSHFNRSKQEKQSRHYHNHQSNQKRRNHSQKDDFHKLNLNPNRIVIIENPEQFQYMLNEIQNEILIAFDSEWKPSFQIGTTISLIQLAKYDKIFLIDSQSNEISNDLWSELGKKVFNNLEMIKIGFALNHDLIMFQKAIPAMNVSTDQQCSYIDLQELWRKLLGIPGFQFPYESTTSKEALSHLVQICLGKQLDKSNQFSNWGRRPLRKEQITYAALDAYCLLEIYTVICKQLNKIGYNINDVIDNSKNDLKINNQQTKGNYRKQYKQKVQNNEIVPPGPNVQPKSVSNVKFVCDDMVEGLARALRKFGIDSLAISYKQRDQIVQIAIQENRYLLTRGNRYVKLREHLPPGYCYYVKNDYVDDQVEEVLCYFNVIVTKNDIFSRCQMCNSNEFLLISRECLQLIDNCPENISLEEIQKICDEQNEKNANLNENKRNFIITKITPEIIKSQITNRGELIKITIIPDNVLSSIDQFYICEVCGKIYWDGSHWQKVVLGRFENIILNEN